MILLRHGQSEFNLHYTATRRDPGIRDPRLTELGHAQAAASVGQLAGFRIGRIISSPYTRALQTAAPLAAARGIPVVINPLVRERYAFVCDVGSPRSALEGCFPEHDFSVIEEIWWPQAEEPASSTERRAAVFRGEMAALPDWADTVVVCHWGFIMAPDRAEPGEWPVAADRPDRGAARADFLARLSGLAGARRPRPSGRCEWAPGWSRVSGGEGRPACYAPGSSEPYGETDVRNARVGPGHAAHRRPAADRQRPIRQGSLLRGPGRATGLQHPARGRRR